MSNTETASSASEIREAVLASNAAYGCTAEEVAAGEPILYVSVGRASNDRNSRRGWLAHYAFAVEFADGTFAAATDADGMMSTRYLRRFDVSGGERHAEKAFARMVGDAGVRLRTHNACR